MDDNPSVWTIEHEKILVEWADKAMCYRWLHNTSNKKFSTLNTLYTIPVIVISTLTGTANFAQDRMSPQYQGMFVMAIGGFNILAGIITTVQQFLQITQLNEAHRVSCIAWDKFYRNIKIELAKHPNERMPVKEMFKIYKQEFDRLMETSPIIPDEIINKFNSAFIGNEDFEHVKKPEICNVMIPTDKYRNAWYLNDPIKKSPTEIELNLLRHQECEQLKENEQNMITERNMEIIHNFKHEFMKENNRFPIQDEYVSNLHDKLNEYTLLTLLKDTNIIEEDDIPNSV